MDSQIEPIARKQAVKVAANLRLAASMLKLYHIQDTIERKDAGKSFVDELTAFLVQQIEGKGQKTLTLKGKSAA